MLYTLLTGYSIILHIRACAGIGGIFPAFRYLIGSIEIQSAGAITDVLYALINTDILLTFRHTDVVLL